MVFLHDQIFFPAPSLNLQFLLELITNKKFLFSFDFQHTSLSFLDVTTFTLTLHLDF